MTYYYRGEEVGQREETVRRGECDDEDGEVEE